MDKEKLGLYREKIDRLDRQIAALISERAATAREIGKAKGGAPVYDPVREKQVIDGVAENCPDLDREAVERIYREIISLCRGVQYRPKAAFGARGIFSHEAVLTPSAVRWISSPAPPSLRFWLRWTRVLRTGGCCLRRTPSRGLCSPLWMPSCRRRRIFPSTGRYQSPWTTCLPPGRLPLGRSGRSSPTPRPWGSAESGFAPIFRGLGRFLQGAPARRPPFARAGRTGLPYAAPSPPRGRVCAYFGENPGPGETAPASGWWAGALPKGEPEQNFLPVQREHKPGRLFYAMEPLETG